MDKKAQINWMIFIVVYGITLLSIWILPKTFGLNTFGLGFKLILSVILAVIAYVIVAQVGD